jgi:hypothetical protein
MGSHDGERTKMPLYGFIAEHQQIESEKNEIILMKRKG